MFISRWTPHAECSMIKGLPSVVYACTRALNRMPTSADLKIFGPEGTVGIDVPLPVQFSDCRSTIRSSFHALLHLLTCPTATSACKILISSTGPPLAANWYGIWTSVVSMIAMCARDGKEGYSTSKGMCSLAFH